MVYKILMVLAVVAVIVGGVYMIKQDSPAGGGIVENPDSGKVEEPMNENTNVSGTMALLETSEGNIKVKFYPDDAPKTVANFVKLATGKFYDGLIFHRVIPDFMIQGGDPKGNGTGGPGYKFEDELNPASASAKEGYKKGVLAMANAGPNTNGSQFFIMVNNVPLPYSYTIFGKVIEGQDVADKISKVPTGPADRPVTPVVIKKVTIL